MVEFLFRLRSSSSDEHDDPEFDAELEVEGSGVLLRRLAKKVLI
jgi:hypothetical protein